jgi:hypothetical protein
LDNKAKGVVPENFNREGVLWGKPVQCAKPVNFNAACPGFFYVQIVFILSCARQNAESKNKLFEICFQNKNWEELYDQMDKIEWYVYKFHSNYL